VATPDSEVVAARRKRDGSHFTGKVGDTAINTPLLDIPDSEGLVAASTGKVASIGRK
jgi:hypothetical protein